MSTKKQKAQALFRDANKLYKGQLYKKALKHYQKATELAPTFYNAHFCIGKTKIRLQHFEEGVKYFSQHINLIPEQEQSTYALGLAGILLEEGQEEKALTLVENQDGDFNEDQLSTFLKILLANGKINKVLLHLLNLPYQKASELYKQLISDQPIESAYRKKFEKEYVIPQYYKATEKVNILSSISLQNSDYSEQVEETLNYLARLKKDFGSSLKLALHVVNDKINNVQELLAEKIEDHIEQKNISRAEKLLQVLKRTSDHQKIDSFDDQITKLKQGRRNKFLKYGAAILGMILLIWGGIELWGYIRQRSVWNEAKETDTYKAYRNYLVQYPHGKHINQAKKNAETAFWNMIKDDSTEEKFQHYLDKYQTGRFRGKARNKLNALTHPSNKTGSTPRTSDTGDNQDRTSHSPHALRNARVTGSDVIIRSDHTTESDVAGIVKSEGTQVRILDEYYPTNTDEAILKKDIKVYANDHFINLHKGKAVSILTSSGNQFKVQFATEKDGNLTATIAKSDLESINSKKWYKVRTKDNTTGWIYGKFIEEL